jgi:hypothetical protein
MPSFIIVRFSICVVVFHVVFEVSLLVEVRLRGSLSALSARPLFSPPLSCFSFDNNKTPKQ